MTAKYFNSVDAVSDYAAIYPANIFNVVNNPQTCGCNGVRLGYDVSDRQDSEVIERLIVCPVCAKQTHEQTVKTII